jgi:hypothetical protein
VKLSDILIGAGAVVGAVAAIIVPIAIWNGIIVHLLWRWFVVPLGVSEIGILHAIGLSLLASVWKGLGRKPDDEPFGKSVARSFGGGIFIIAIAYVAKLGMAL